MSVAVVGIGTEFVAKAEMGTLAQALIGTH
jgi:hypothetical protein